MEKSSLSSTRKHRKSTVRQTRAQSPLETAMNSTIDLTNDSFSSSISSPPNDVYYYRPSSISVPEIIDLSAETDDPPVMSEFCYSDLLKIEDDLPPPPKIPALDQPKVPKLSCPICFEDMSKDRSVMTTKCGHLFCKDCILDSLKVRSFCPLCRKKVLKSQLVVVYLNPVA